MKINQKIVLLTAFAFTFSLSSCMVFHKRNAAKPLPPGQEKKLRGSKSAKPYAPGQKKKKVVKKKSDLIQYR